MLHEMRIFSITAVLAGGALALTTLLLQRNAARRLEPGLQPHAMKSLPALLQEGAMSLIFCSAGLFFAEHLLRNPWHAAIIAIGLLLMSIIGGHNRFLGSLTETTEAFVSSSRRNYFVFSTGICLVITAGLAVFINHKS